jgi:hypothetical protein
MLMGTFRTRLANEKIGVFSGNGGPEGQSVVYGLAAK